MSRFILILFVLFSIHLSGQNQIIDISEFSCTLYPGLNEDIPELPSPFLGSDGNEYVIAVNIDNKYAIIPVSLSNDRGICKQLVVDTFDFPDLAKTGLHKDSSFIELETITGKTLSEITTDGRPGGLSSDGFMASDEDVLSVLIGDNQIVKRLDLTHPQLAKPLFHVLNMMDEDLNLDRWNMRIHQWDHITYFFYNKKKINVIARDTKGGQKSIFNDGIGGAFHITLWREFDDEEIEFLKKIYNHLTSEQFSELKKLLSTIDTGEMEPQYIMRYGFYEGHTGWRTDPVAISFIFGLRMLSELEEIYTETLYEVLTTHFVE
jgi:hypothetical protein